MVAEMNQQDFEQRALNAIAKGAYLEESSFDLNATFTDLGLESMDLIEIIFELEDEFGVNLPLEENTNLSQMNGHQLLAMLKEIVESSDNRKESSEEGGKNSESG